MAEVERSEGHGGIYALLIVVVILILGVALYFSGMLGNRGGDEGLDVDVDIEAPATPAPSGPGEGG
ncbi:MAG TPA: hypothetical protein VFZ24_09660 [Longimicrobiales bacterium]